MLIPTRSATVWHYHAPYARNSEKWNNPQYSQHCPQYDTAQLQYFFRSMTHSTSISVHEIFVWPSRKAIFCLIFETRPPAKVETYSIYPFNVSYCTQVCNLHGCTEHSRRTPDRISPHHRFCRCFNLSRQNSMFLKRHGRQTEPRVARLNHLEHRYSLSLFSRSLSLQLANTRPNVRQRTRNSSRSRQPASVVMARTFCACRHD